MDQQGAIERKTETTSIFANFIVQVYFWMAAGLLVTFGIAMALGNRITHDSSLYDTLSNLLPILFILELILVIAISAGASKFSTSVSALLFLLYSIANGIFFGAIFSIYASDTIALTFAATFITFGVMAMYGYFSKQDLTKFGNIALMSLFGIIIGSIINIFLVSETVYWIITYVGIIVFIILVAYDTQKLKTLAIQAEMSGIPISRYAIRGALTLYLDFINLFIMILRIFGGRKK